MDIHSFGRFGFRLFVNRPRPYRLLPGQPSLCQISKTGKQRVSAGTTSYA